MSLFDVQVPLRLAAVMALLMLVACAPVPTRMREATPAAEAAQAAREAALSPRTHWTISAHIGVTTARDSGSGDLEWRQDGDTYTFTMRAPITGKTWKLHGNADGAELEGVESKTIADTDVERLLRDHIGWDVPLAALRAWAFGLRASGSVASVQYDERNLPTSIEQGGWSVEYRDWFTAGDVAGTDLPLPKRVFASSGTTKIKLAVYDWSLGQ